MTQCFDHEKLRVYQEAIRFVNWTGDILAMLPKGSAAHSQLDRASISIPLNIAEGNGKFTAADRCRFFDTARGSALECAACLDVLVARKQIPASDAEQGRRILLQIVSMLVGLIQATSTNRVYDPTTEYEAKGEQGQKGDYDYE